MSDLRTRARAGTQVARRDPAELKQKIKAMEAQFQLAMPRGMEAAQIVRDAMTVLSTNPKLGTVDGASVLGALMTCSQLGLRPGVLGQAYVIPFKGKAKLVIGYQGLVMLAQRSADIASISARIVHANDHFDYEFGLDERLVHKPLMTGDRGEAVAYYCVIKTRGGGTLWEVMSKTDAEQHRDKFAMQRDYESGAIKGPWVEHFDAMALKTVIIRTLKLAPRSTEVMTALVADNSVRVDITPTADITTSLVDIPQDDEEVVEGVVEQDEGPDPTLDPSWGKQT